MKLALCVSLIWLTTSFARGQDGQGDINNKEFEALYSKLDKKDLVSAGRTLSFGGIFTNDLSVDTTKINQGELQNKAISSTGKKIIGLELGLSSIPYVRRAGTAITVVEAGKAMWDAWRVGTGRAEPNVLRSTIPHVIQAWDAMKGPQNLPTQSFSTQINRNYNDGALKMQTQVNQTFRQDFSTTAPGKIGNYGYDPYTDKIIRQTKTYSTQTTSFNGNQFNKMYQSQRSAMPTYTPPPRISAPPIYKYTPPPTTSQPIFKRR